MMPIITKIRTKDELEAAYEIRRKVFVGEQKVAPEEEYDEFEAVSLHFLAKMGSQPVGTARWRETSEGVKLERFAVIQSMRGKGVGEALVNFVLEDLKASLKESGGKLRVYMHAQIQAETFYKKFGFKRVGDIFIECRITHVEMERFL